MTDDTGFYSLAQLCSRSETERQKGRVGVFPWSRTKILAMIERGEFPQPVRGLGRANLWPKATIREYAERIGGERHV